MKSLEKYLHPAHTIDSDNPAIQEKAGQLIKGLVDAKDKAKSLFYFTRDEIRYNPYASLYPLKASSTLIKGDGFCVQKAALLAALSRSASIPARLGFVDIRNHRLDPDWQTIFRTDVVVFHGFAELFIDNGWIKATPAFDLRMCQDNNFLPVEFDSTTHAMLHSIDANGHPHIDYIGQRSNYDDAPVDTIIEAVTQAYGQQFLECWKTGVWDHFLGNQNK